MDLYFHGYHFLGDEYTIDQLHVGVCLCLSDLVCDCVCLIWCMFVCLCLCLCVFIFASDWVSYNMSECCTLASMMVALLFGILNQCKIHLEKLDYRI